MPNSSCASPGVQDEERMGKMSLMVKGTANGVNTQELAYPQVTTIFDGSSTGMQMWGLVYDPGQSMLFFTKTDPGEVWRSDLQGGASKVADRVSETKPNGDPKVERLDQPEFMTLAGGQVYFSDTGKMRLRQMNALDPDYEVLPVSNFWSDNMDDPQGIVSLPDGLLFVADRGLDAIKTVRENEAASTLAGSLNLKPFSIAFNANDEMIYFAVSLRGMPAALYEAAW
eukprot:339786-Pelagomonas_calceolata.AAC.2